jgi:cell division protein FtsQ
MAKSKKKKVRIRYGRIFAFLLLVTCTIFGIVKVINTRVTNIYITGNTIYNDQEIIDLAGLTNYPRIISISNRNIENKLKKNIYIKDVIVTRTSFLRKVNIEITENKPILYYQYDNVYLLSDGKKTTDKFEVPILINQTPEDVLKRLLKKMVDVDQDVLYRISEIRYYPSNVDSELFYLTMNDGNYIYINIQNLKKLNNYIEIVRSFDNKKGIIHLDSGNYLEAF